MQKKRNFVAQKINRYQRYVSERNTLKSRTIRYGRRSV